jgi:tRNA pseudouridine38-40 synthase
MRNIKLLLEYEGTRYPGWQTQKKEHAPSIQEILEEKLFKITHARVKLIASGRTDAGVHALGQPAAFKTESGISTDVLGKALNSMLPDDIRVISAEEVPMEFHPRYDAIKKTYSYLIGLSSVLPVFLRRYMWAVPYKLDLNAMEEAALLIKGEHDFCSFRASGCGAKSTVRNLMELEIKRMRKMDFLSFSYKGDFLKVSLAADGFLRHMARNIVGTLVEIGRGRIEPEAIRGIMASRDRKKAGPAAPACGLFLEKVYY